MSLRKALGALPDDRETLATVREVVSFLHEHRSQSVQADRIARVTGLSEPRVTIVMKALADSFVIDCDGDPRLDPCTFEPDLVLTLEVERFLRSAEGSSARLQRGVDRFRSRHDSSI